MLGILENLGTGQNFATMPTKVDNDYISNNGCISKIIVSYSSESLSRYTKLNSLPSNPTIIYANRWQPPLLIGFLLPKELLASIQMHDIWWQEVYLDGRTDYELLLN